MIAPTVMVRLYTVDGVDRSGLFASKIRRAHVTEKCRFYRQASDRTKGSRSMPIGDWFDLLLNRPGHVTGLKPCKSCGMLPKSMGPVRGVDIREAWRAVARARLALGDREGAKRARMAAAIIR